MQTNFRSNIRIPLPNFHEQHAKPRPAKIEVIEELGKWFSNKKNAGIYASSVGCVACSVLLAAHIWMAIAYIYYYLIGEIFFLLASVLLFGLAFCGLKRDRPRLILIFLIGEAIKLAIVVMDVIFLITTKMFDNECSDSWMEPGGGKCYYYRSARWAQYNISLSWLSALIYLVASLVLYRLIWRAYRFISMQNQGLETPHAQIPTVCSPTYVTEICEPAETSIPNLSSNSPMERHHQPLEQGYQSTFFDHQKCVEYERNILRGN
ncbi:hypothetical protein DdX_16240 [Ditylenchus destructor]|uniref:Uncharacterized protein n=1 Tax=Ditylenchus destructor TaxID=166010 RepID=A0AAD4R029_9BILA|nr:hypothetical protein DdX_16240 [Ditylenchus destructor]